MNEGGADYSRLHLPRWPTALGSHPECFFAGHSSGFSCRVRGVAETFEQLRAENIQLRQQANYYKSLHAKTLAKLERATAIITALKQKVAETGPAALWPE